MASPTDTITIADPVADLREAARLMRLQDGVATAAPWKASPVYSPDSHATSAVYSHAHQTGTAASKVVPSVLKTKRRGGGIYNPHNAVLIAEIRQVVAPLADLLGHAADEYDRRHQMCAADDLPHPGHPSCPRRQHGFDAALAVAYAFLGRPVA